jgi:hypothetical protein
MSSYFGQYDLHAGTIRCPGCGKDGMVEWEDMPDRSGVTRQLVKIVGDFYERLSKKPPYPIELVCKDCGTAQTGPLQS